jgi:DNA-binding NarL/FixJ family response regulator
VRILLVDDHTVLRLGLRQLIETEPLLQVIGEAGNADQAMQQARRLHPDLVVMDLRMPGEDGISATKRITAELPGTRVVVFSGFADEKDVLRALRAGATGYFLKGDDSNDVLHGLRDALTAEASFGPSVTQRLLARVMQPEEGAPPAPSPSLRRRKDALTPRETAVLRLMAAGKKNREIAAILGIGEGTVAGHETRIFRRLRVGRRTEAIRYAIRNGLVG